MKPPLKEKNMKKDKGWTKKRWNGGLLADAMFPFPCRQTPSGSHLPPPPARGNATFLSSPLLYMLRNGHQLPPFTFNSIMLPIPKSKHYPSWLFFYSPGIPIIILTSPSPPATSAVPPPRRPPRHARVSCP